MQMVVKSKQRIRDHGEVYTPEWLVNDMLDLVKDVFLPEPSKDYPQVDFFSLADGEVKLGGRDCE